MKFRLLQLLTLVLVLTYGFIAGRSWPSHASLDELHDAFVEGQRDTTAYVENCTLVRAHAGECSIPCSGDGDCVAKNGSREAY